jgi:hypothetical protein
VSPSRREVRNDSSSSDCPRVVRDDLFSDEEVFFPLGDGGRGTRAGGSRGRFSLSMPGRRGVGERRLTGGRLTLLEGVNSIVRVGSVFKCERRGGSDTLYSSLVSPLVYLFSTVLPTHMGPVSSSVPLQFLNILATSPLSLS